MRHRENHSGESLEYFDQIYKELNTRVEKWIYLKEKLPPTKYIKRYVLFNSKGSNDRTEEGQDKLRTQARTSEWPTCHWNCSPPWILSPTTLPQAHAIPLHPWSCWCWVLPLIPVDFLHRDTDEDSHNWWVTFLSCGTHVLNLALALLLVPVLTSGRTPLLWCGPYLVQSMVK